MNRPCPRTVAPVEVIWSARSPFEFEEEARLIRSLVDTSMYQALDLVPATTGVRLRARVRVRDDCVRGFEKSWLFPQVYLTYVRQSKPISLRARC